MIMMRGMTQSLLLILLPPKEISQPAPNNIDSTKPQRRTPQDPPRRELALEALFPAARDDEVGGGPGGGDARGVGRVAVEVQVRGEEQDWREEHGQFCEGLDVLGCYQGC